MTDGVEALRTGIMEVWENPLRRQSRLCCVSCSQWFNGRSLMRVGGLDLRPAFFCRHMHTIIDVTVYTILSTFSLSVLLFYLGFSGWDQAQYPLAAYMLMVLVDLGLGANPKSDLMSRVLGLRIRYSRCNNVILRGARAQLLFRLK